MPIITHFMPEAGLSVYAHARLCTSEWLLSRFHGLLSSATNPPMRYRLAATTPPSQTSDRVDIGVRDPGAPDALARPPLFPEPLRTGRAFQVHAYLGNNMYSTLLLSTHTL